MRFIGSKYAKNAFAATDPAEGDYSAPPDLLAGFKGRTSKERGREGKRREERGR